MFSNIKMLNTIGLSHLMATPKRKKYAFGNTQFDVKTSRKEVYQLAQKMCKRMLKSAKVTVEVKGKENLPKEGPVLYVASHKSLFDIVVLMSIIDDPCIYVGKKEIAKMPFIKDWFEALGCIYLDREDKRKSLQSIIKGIEELKSGQSVVIFPEGTRHYGDEIQKFKEGSFKLALKSQVPIIPIALHNTYKVFEQKRSITKTTVTVNIGKPIATKGLSNEEARELPLRTEEVVRMLMNEILTSLE